MHIDYTITADEWADAAYFSDWRWHWYSVPLRSLVLLIVTVNVVVGVLLADDPGRISYGNLIPLLFFIPFAAFLLYMRRAFYRGVYARRPQLHGPQQAEIEPGRLAFSSGPSQPVDGWNHIRKVVEHKGCFVFLCRHPLFYLLPRLDLYAIPIHELSPQQIEEVRGFIRDAHKS